MANRAKHAFGSSERVAESIANGIIDSYDILFLDGDTDNPKIGWVDKNGNPVILKDEKADLSELEADVAELESQIATKVGADEVDAKVEQAMTDSVADANAYTDKMVEAAMGEHLTKKYEIANVPEGTLVDYRENEIRIMCKADAVFTKQNVGAGGDANSYYMTFKTYAPSDDAVGYIEHLGDKVDEEILTSFNVDEYGRRYQPTWLALAKYDEATDTWAYYGKDSNKNRYIGWDYQIDWYNADGVMIGSDSVRINLSNENCHSSIEPYYVGSMMKEVETMIEEKITEVDSAYEIIEF